MTSESQSTHNPVGTVGLVCALHKPGAVEFARLLVQRLEAAKVQILAEEELAQVAGDACQVRTRADLAAAADLVIAMGGDGTAGMALCCRWPTMRLRPVHPCWGWTWVVSVSWPPNHRLPSWKTWKSYWGDATARSLA